MWKMNRYKWDLRSAKLAVFGGIAFALVILMGGQSAEAQEVKDYELIYRQDASREYVDPTSFFFLHGYATAVFQDFEEGFHTLENIGGPQGGRNMTTSAPAGLVGRPGNVTLANTDRRTWSHDVGIIYGAHIHPQLTLMGEIHLINDNAANSVFKTIVPTQAKIIWQPLEDVPFRLTAGRQWTTFGIGADDLLSAQNYFSVVPQALSTIPDKFIEGVTADGAFYPSDNLGVNYALTVGNGNNAFDKPGGGSFENDNNQTIIARIGILPINILGIGEDERLELGVSWSGGELRKGQPGSTTVPELNNADATAWGVDLSYSHPKFGARVYYMSSDEELVSQPTLQRTGFVAEAKYKLIEKLGFMGGTWIKGRYDRFTRDGLLATAAAAGQTLSNHREMRDERISLGVGFHPLDNFSISAEYHLSDESGSLTEVSDDGYTLAVTANF